jgi:hypothetical protein
MSPALLSKRLRTLTRAGVVERRDDGPRVTYALTEAGEELRPIVEALGAWGIRLPAVPEGRTVVRFSFTDARVSARQRWMLITPEDVDPCDFDPGLPEQACVETDLRSLTMVWRGDLGWAEALRSGRVEVSGPGWARRSVPRWLGQSPLAGVPRVAAAAT